jgi:hypothetical protein
MEEKLADRRLKKLHNKELRNLFFSPSVITMTKSRRMSWAGFITREWGKIIQIGNWWRSQNERDN